MHSGALQCGACRFTLKVRRRLGGKAASPIMTIHEMALIQKHLPDTEKAEKVIFVIITDGLENASRAYSRARVREMIEHEKEKYGWEFIFLGANMDAVKEAGSLGIAADRSVTFENDSQGIEINYRAVSQAVCRMRSASPQAAPVGADWKKEIEEDYESCRRMRFKKTDSKRL